MVSGEGLGDYPKTCAVCEQPINYTRCPEPLWFEWTGGARRSYHVRCKLQQISLKNLPKTLENREPMV